MATTIVPPYSVQGTPFEDRPAQGSVNYGVNGQPSPIDASTQDDIIRLLKELVQHARLINSGASFEDE